MELKSKIEKLIGDNVEQIVDTTVTAVLEAIADLNMEELVGLVTTGKVAKTKRAVKPVKATVKAKPTAKVSSARRLQGCYMGLLRGFKGAERNRIRKLATTDKAAAVREMKAFKANGGKPVAKAKVSKPKPVVKVSKPKPVAKPVVIKVKESKPVEAPAAPPSE